MQTQCAIAAGALTLKQVYGENAFLQEKRFSHLTEIFHETYAGHETVLYFSSPGRTEIGGNHTDHNAGRVLAAAVDLDIILAAAPNNSDAIRVTSDAFGSYTVDCTDLSIHGDDRFSTPALIRGVCDGLRRREYAVSGFDAYVSSTVPPGSGLSSSAAFEVAVGQVVNVLFNDASVSPVELAKIGQFAENDHFGKPCGLMDQSACAVGGCLFIDFADLESPVMENIPFEEVLSGCALVITNTGGSHASLNDEYNAIENEMKQVAAFFGAQYLRELSLRHILENIPALRSKVPDRAILRAMHFFSDDERVVRMVGALNKNDADTFLSIIRESGESSWMYCQNCYCPGHHENQEIAVALAASARIIGNRGAWRVHGGGFAGTIQAFVPHDMVDTYIRAMENICSKGAAHICTIRKAGVVEVAV